VSFALVNPITGQTYQWKNGNTVVGSNSSFSATLSGNYRVVVTNPTGCKDSSAAVIVHVVNPQVSPVGPVQICQGGSTSLTVSNIGTATVKWD
jgi:oligosaccharide reducing-end xylanase